MNPTAKKLWLEALRSGEFEQARGRLQSSERYCCLGVLQAVAVREGVKIKESDWRTWFGAHAVREWAGLASDDAKELASLNDGDVPENYGATEKEQIAADFHQIAACIEHGL
jgi:hypothetical protein